MRSNLNCTFDSFLIILLFSCIQTCDTLIKETLCVDSCSNRNPLLLLYHMNNISGDVDMLMTNNVLLKETRLNKSFNPHPERYVPYLLPLWLQSAGCGGEPVCKTPSNDT